MNYEKLSKDQLKQLKESAEFRIELAECIKRLQKNPDFKKLTNYYFNNEPVRLVHLLADPDWCDPNKRKLIEQQMFGIAQFNLFLQVVRVQGETEKKTLEDIDNLDSMPNEAEDTVIQ